MSENEAKEIANAVVEWLYNNRKISEPVYGRMTMDGEGEDVTALAEVIMTLVNT
jgi:hypothetical protein